MVNYCRDEDERWKIGGISDQVKMSSGEYEAEILGRVMRERQKSEFDPNLEFGGEFLGLLVAAGGMYRQYIQYNY